jgi:hypothetical protein
MACGVSALLSLVASAALAPMSAPGPRMQTGQIVFLDRVTVSGDRIGAVDVANLSALPPPVRAGLTKLVIVRPAGHARALVFSKAWLGTRIAALVPAARRHVDSSLTGTVTIQWKPAEVAAAPRVARVAEADVRKGDRVNMAVTVGVVTIERAGTALQDARAGRRVFVKMGDRDVIAVKLPGA